MMNKPEFPKPRIIRESFLPEPMTELTPEEEIKVLKKKLDIFLLLMLLVVFVLLVC